MFLWGWWWRYINYILSYFSWDFRKTELISLLGLIGDNIRWYLSIWGDWNTDWGLIYWPLNFTSFLITLSVVLSCISSIQHIWVLLVILCLCKPQLAILAISILLTLWFLNTGLHLLGSLSLWWLLVRNADIGLQKQILIQAIHRLLRPLVFSNPSSHAFALGHSGCANLIAYFLRLFDM